MKRIFFSNLLLVVAVNVVIKGVYLFGVERNVQNALGAEAYGWYFDVFNFCMLFQIVLDFGFQNYNTRYVAQHPQLLKKYFPSILSAKLFLVSLYVVIVYISGYYLFQTSMVRRILFPIIGIQVLASLYLFFRSNVAGLGLYRADSLLSGLSKALMVVLVGVPLYLFSSFSMEYFIWGQLLALLLANVAIIWLLRGQLRIRGARKPVMIWLLRGSVAYALIGFFMTIYTRVDAVMLERLLPEPMGAQQVGIYAASYRLLDALNLLGLLMAGLLLPMFSKQIKKGEPIQPLSKLAFGLLCTAAAAIAVTSIFWADEIMYALYTDADPTYSPVYKCLILTFLSWAVVYVYGTLLLASGRLWEMVFLFGICAFLNVGLNVWLIPEHFAFGSAIATLATQSIAALFLLGLTAYFFPAFRSGYFLVRCMILIALTVFSAWIIFTFVPLLWLWQWLVSIFVAVCIALFLGVLPFKQGTEFLFAYLKDR